MSLALHQADRMVRVSDPRLEFDNQGIQVISDSATGLIYQKFSAPTPTGSIINFNTFQQPTQAISTKMFVKCQFEVVINSGSNAKNALGPNVCAPRQFPLSSIALNARIQINGASNDIYPNQIVHALMRYNNSTSELGRDFSTCPSFPDMYQEYMNGGSNVGGYSYVDNGTTRTQGYGTGNSALANVGECSFDMEPRGGWVYDEVVLSGGGGQQIATVKFTTFEPIIISPLNFSHNNQKSLIGVNTLNVTYNLGDVKRVMSLNNRAEDGTEIAGREITSAKIIGQPELYTVLMQPKMIDKINPVQIYPWNQIFPYQQTFTMPTGVLAKTTVPFNTIQLSGVPKRIYIYAKRANEDATTTDTFAQIQSLNVQFDTISGIFGGAPMQQLYQVCAENDYNGSYIDWAYQSGSIMCIDCEKDLPIKENLAVGSQKNITFSFTAEFGRLLRPYDNVVAAEDYKLYCMVVYDGIFSIDQAGTPLFQLNTVTPTDVLRSASVQRIPYHALNTFASGGSFGSKLASIGSFAKKLGRKAIGAYENLSEDDKRAVGNIVSDAATMVSPALGKAIQDFGPAAYDRAKQLVGLGYSEDQIYGLLAGAGLKKKKTVGGKKLTKAQLQKLATM
jgi:hypothetical protein